MRSTVATSIPYTWSPINASPEIFNSTRRYFGAEAITNLLVAGHLFDFVSKVAVRLFHALADLEADKSSNFDWRAKFLGCLFNDLFDARLAINDECLMQQNCLIIEFPHASLHHLLDDMVGLAGLFRYFCLNRTFTIDDRLVQMRRRQRQWRSCRDVHGDLFA